MRLVPRCAFRLAAVPCVREITAQIQRLQAGMPQVVGLWHLYMQTAAIRACRDASQSSCLPALRKMVRTKSGLPACLPVYGASAVTGCHSSVLSGRVRQA